MADKSAIEWTDATWNPIVGCSIVSPGCTHCYAMKMAGRIEAMGNAAHYAGTTRKKVNGHTIWTGKLALTPQKTLLQPLAWRAPRRIFVNSMGDLFHEDVPDAWIDQVFAVMALSPQHTFQVLTKRAKRMREYLARRPISPPVGEMSAKPTEGGAVPPSSQREAPPSGLPAISPTRGEISAPWPLPNVWLGVSAERQQEADERIPELLATAAHVRFVSAEPLLGPIDFQSALGGTLWMGGQRGHDGQHRHSGKAGDIIHGLLHATDPSLLHHHHDERCGRGLAWIIAGGESGPDARPMHPDWPRAVRDQCQAAGVPFFFKQWGAWRPYKPSAGGDLGGDIRAGRVISAHPTGQSDTEVFVETGRNTIPGTRYMCRVAKKAAGRLLDGIEHNGFPCNPVE